MWLVYLRFDDQGQAKTYHIYAENEKGVKAILELAEKRGLTATAKLVEYSVFYAHSTIKPKQVPNFHFYRAQAFTDRWKAGNPQGAG